MAWNTGHAKYKSTGPGGGLAGLDCGHNLKFARTETTAGPLWAEFTTPTGGLEKGACVAMIRVPAGTRVMGAELFCTPLGANDQTTVILAVGDPYACARLLGPCCVTAGSWSRASNNSSAIDLVAYDCFSMRRVGRVGDGCGVGYTYTCETDIQITNLDHSGQATLGGWAGSVATAATPLGSATTAGGKIILRLDVMPL